MSHVDSYRNNEEYADFLDGWDPSFFSKYIQSLRSEAKDGQILDVGCGVGQVVKALRDSGFNAQGVDVSEPNIRKATEHVGHCSLYDGTKLPFKDSTFESVGAFNVLEHVEEPEAFIQELVRVLKPAGRLVLSSPNFLRVLGFRDYHVRMRGLANKWRNAKQQFSILREIRNHPSQVRFERMPPIVKEPFTPDDDAIVVTNPLHMQFFVAQQGCDILSVACTDREVPVWADWALNLPILKYLWFNSFVVARKQTDPTIPQASEP